MEFWCSAEALELSNVHVWSSPVVVCSPGLMEDMPTDAQNLRSWLEDKNLEMRGALDAGDTEAISLLGPLIAKGPDHMRAICRCEISDEEFRSRSAPGEGRFAPF